MNFGSSELIIVLVIVLLVFGGSQLPKLAKNLGKAQKGFKEGMGEGASSTTPPQTPPPASSAMPPPPPPPPSSEQ